MHCSTTTDRRIISQPHYAVVGRYQKQKNLLNHKNRIETTVSTHTRKRQHKLLQIASVSSYTGVSNIQPAGQNRPVARLNPAREMIL